MVWAGLKKRVDVPDEESSYTIDLQVDAVVQLLPTGMRECYTTHTRLTRER